MVCLWSHRIVFFIDQLITSIICVWLQFYTLYVVNHLQQQCNELILKFTRISYRLPKPQNNWTGLGLASPEFSIINCAVALFFLISPNMSTVHMFQAILNNLPPSDIVESASVAGPGYVNIVISSEWIAQVQFRCFILGPC